jgi:hypothetical protein
MAGLPHFTNSKAATKYFEPFYQNLFEVSILPPSTIAGGEILLEHVRKIGGLTNEKMEAVVEQKYKFATRSYAKSAPDSTTVDLAIGFSLNLNDANELYVYKTLRDWNRLIYNPLTGEQGLKKDYVGTIVVSNYNRAGDIFWQRTFYGCFPTGSEMAAAAELNYDTAEPAELEMTWRADYWTEDMV